jgi:hypothetical protein
LALALGVLLMSASCLGPNNATAQLAKWNNGLDGKWGNEIAFIFLLPVYAIFSLGDVLIFNSIYWWTGNNPISPPEGGHPGAVLIKVSDVPYLVFPAEEE